MFPGDANDDLYSPESAARQFADKIAEYIRMEAKTPEEALKLAEVAIEHIRKLLQAEDWQAQIDQHNNFVKHSGNTMSFNVPTEEDEA